MHFHTRHCNTLCISPLAAEGNGKLEPDFWGSGPSYFHSHFPKHTKRKTLNEPQNKTNKQKKTCYSLK